MGVLSSSRLAWACSQGSGQRAMLSRPCEACHFASFCWPSQVTRPAQKLQKYAVPRDGKRCKVVWQRGQLQARAGESWPPTVYSLCGLPDLMLKKRFHRPQHLPTVVIVVLLLSRVLLFAIPWMLALKIVKYLRINLTKDVKDLCNETCKALMKKLTKGQINREPACAHGLEELTLLKCPYYPELCTNSTESLSKFQHRKKKNLKICMEP